MEIGAVSVVEECRLTLPTLPAWRTISAMAGIASLQYQISQAITMYCRRAINCCAMLYEREPRS
jgi:hypothetical protein